MADFAAQIAAFAKKANISTEKAFKGTAISLFGAVIESTPVDKGSARANWQLSDSSPATGTVDATDISGSSTTSKVANGISSAIDWSAFTLTNNLPYAQRLEYGWSDQAPAGMVRVNVARFESILNKEAKKNG